MAGRCSAAALTILLAGLAACGGSEAQPPATTAPPQSPAPITTLAAAPTVPQTTPVPPPTPPDTTLAPTTTEPATAPPSTTQPATTSTTESPRPDVVTVVTAPPYLPDEPGRTPPVFTGNGGAHGSGCAPGPGPLPDGVWFGYLLTIEDATVTFDLACFYTGEMARWQAAQRGETAENDFWIGNENPTARAASVAVGASVWAFTRDVSDGADELTFGTEWTGAESSYSMCPGEGCPVWLYINDGVVDVIVEQYLP